MGTVSRKRLAACRMLYSRAPDPAPRATGAGPAGSGDIRRRGRLGGEAGQSAVEFAMVVPFICAIVLILVDFGKSMNYWLDLTQVANEGARLAAVNSPITEDAIRDRLKTWELRSGNPSSGGADQADVSVCVGGAGEVGDPVTVELTSNYKWFAFPDWMPFVGGGSLTLKGSATMRLEQPTDAWGAC